MTGDNFIDLNERYIELHRQKMGKLLKIKPQPKESDILQGAVFTLLFCLLLITLFFLFTPRKAHANEIAIQTIAKEASSEPFEAQILVASVIKQRMIDRNMTAEEVCLQPHQFSCWQVKQKKRTLQELLVAKEAWNRARPMGINLYHDVSVSPYWAKKVVFVKQVGKLRFYKE